MTPEFKAMQLVIKMRNKEGYNIPQFVAKACALIAVDEIIKEVSHFSETYCVDLDKHEKNRIEYLQQVKEAIEKM